MDPNLPGNSRTTRETKVTIKTNEPPEKKIEPVVAEGGAIQRKKPLGRRMSETFIGGDAKSVARYVIFDVLVPAAKDMIADATSQGVERMLFGETRSASRRAGGFRPGGSSNFVNYSKMAGAANTARSGLEEFSKKARANHEFDEILLPTRAEAETVIDSLAGLIKQYDVATVADLYGLVGITGHYTDQKWGWVDLRDAGVSRTRAGYLLDLPKPQAVD